MASEAVQMNTRISRSLKESGDAAFKRAGYSPSQAVRKLWEFAALHQHNPEAIRKALEFSESESDHPEAMPTSRADALRENLSVCARAYDALGIKPSALTFEASYDELREYALMERLEEGEPA